MPALAGPPACAMSRGRVSHPTPTAAFSLSQQRGENSVLQSAGCFPGDAGCAASPAEGWCLYCFTTPWLCSAKSGVWMKSKKKTPNPLAWPFAEVGSAAGRRREMQGGELSPIPNRAVPSRGLPTCSPKSCSSISRLLWSPIQALLLIATYRAGREVHGIFFFSPRLAGPRSWDAVAIGGRQAEHFPSRWLMPKP